jgi:hypothetical protein
MAERNNESEETMTITMLPGFASLSEFIAGLNGDCGPTATLALLHEFDAKRWPLDAAALKALDNSEIAGGFAESNGAQNITSLSNYLHTIQVPHATVGYAVFNWDQFHTDLKANAGKNPVLVEWSKAGALPGDEPGVQFHFSTCGGINTGAKGDGVGGGYLWCDGDNRADDQSGAQRPPIFYTIQSVQAAAPCAYIIGALPQPKPPVTLPPAPVDWEAKYNTLKALLAKDLEAN